MIESHPHICLYQPQIPQNTGAIARLAAVSQSRLHLIAPLGFELSDKTVRRAGLDYWPYLDLELHKNFSSFERLFSSKRFAFISKYGKRSYLEIPKSCDVIIFGQETKGLPKEIHEKYNDQLFNLPMFHSEVRSLNLANAVSIVNYHMISQRKLF